MKEGEVIELYDEKTDTTTAYKVIKGTRQFNGQKTRLLSQSDNFQFYLVFPAADWI